MTIGEAMWSARFLQWVAEIASPGMTGIYTGHRAISLVPYQGHHEFLLRLVPHEILSRRSAPLGDAHGNHVVDLRLHRDHHADRIDPGAQVDGQRIQVAAWRGSSPGGSLIFPFWGIRDLSFQERLNSSIFEDFLWPLPFTDVSLCRGKPPDCKEIACFLERWLLDLRCSTPFLRFLSIVVMYRFSFIQVSVASSRNRVRWCRKELITIGCDFSF